MSYIERVVHIDASPADVWAVMIDVERWPEWTPSIAKVVPQDSRPIGVGSRYRVSASGVPGATWRVSEFVEGRSFTWGTDSGVRVVAGHVIEPEASGSKVTLSITTRGLFAPLIVRTSRRNMQIEAEGLKRRSEVLAAKARSGTE
jgi:uncharacterized protein YndB with AHSA1/START domain